MIHLNQLQPHASWALLPLNITRFSLMSTSRQSAEPFIARLKPLALGHLIQLAGAIVLRPHTQVTSGVVPHRRDEAWPKVVAVLRTTSEHTRSCTRSPLSLSHPLKPHRPSPSISVALGLSTNAFVRPRQETA